MSEKNEIINKLFITHQDSNYLVRYSINNEREGQLYYGNFVGLIHSLTNQKELPSDFYNNVELIFPLVYLTKLGVEPIPDEEIKSIKSLVSLLNNFSK